MSQIQHLEVLCVCVCVCVFVCVDETSVSRAAVCSSLILRAVDARSRILRIT